MILALDLSTACTGWAKYDTKGTLLEYGRIIPEDKLHPFLKVKYIVGQLVPIMLEAEGLVVEGIFLNTFTGGFHNVTGFELLARLSGAVINTYLQSHAIIPTLYKASQARKIVGIKATSQKAEIQLWAIRNFDVIESTEEWPDGGISDEGLEVFDALIDAAYAELNTKQIKRPAFKSRMDKISHMIEEQTGVGEDIADAILLGLAYVKDKGTTSDTTDTEQSVS